jgi:hypothetical protein
MRNFRLSLKNKWDDWMLRRAPVLVKRMADTGVGTDECLRLGCLPMNVHFYSPVPDIPDLESRKIWERKSELTGIDFRPEKQVALMRQLGQEYGNECSWPLHPAGKETEFYLKNFSFSYGCAAARHTIIRHFKPRHFIEIGSGHSSKVISRALEKNKQEDSSHTPEYTIVDPYPGEMVSKLPLVSQRIQEKVECVDARVFDSLEENDIVFVDSSHTVKTGSDVNFMLLDVLPRLKPGVLVHFHDINLPYEYPKVYFTNPQFRVFWTEAYLLQAFLAFNSKYEVLLAMNYLQVDHMDEFCEAFAPFKLEDNWANSGSFWIRRTVSA